MQNLMVRRWRSSWMEEMKQRRIKVQPVPSIPPVTPAAAASATFSGPAWNSYGYLWTQTMVGRRRSWRKRRKRVRRSRRWRKRQRSWTGMRRLRSGRWRTVRDMLLWRMRAKCQSRERQSSTILWTFWWQSNTGDVQTPAPTLYSTSPSHTLILPLSPQNRPNQTTNLPRMRRRTFMK